MTANLDFDATGVPRALEDNLSLTVGRRYTISNADSTATAYFRSVAAAAPPPDATARGFPLFPGGTAVGQVVDGYKTYVWTRDPQPCALTVLEEP